MSNNLVVDKETVSAFKSELKNLLEKYNAEIYVELDGDTHCVSDALIIDINNKEIMRFNNPSFISYYDIKIGE